MLIKKWYYPDGEDAGSENSANPDGENKPSTEAQLAKALKEAKSNSVSKEEYEKVLREKDELVAAIINGEGGNDGDQTTPPEVDDNKLREELYGPKCQELNNLQYWEKTLQLRDSVMSKGESDPFLTKGRKASDSEVAIIEKQVGIIKELIREADGDSGVFTALMQKLMPNDSPAFVNHLKKLGIKFN